MSQSMKPTCSPPGKFSASSLSPKLSRHCSSIQPRGFKKVQIGGAIRPVDFLDGPRPIVKYHSLSHGLDFGRTHDVFGKEGRLKSSRDRRGQQKDRLLSSGEKETMQILNDRLASYLEKVRSLQQENAQLEKKIRDWYDRHHPQPLPDFNHYFETIEDLQKKILLAAGENARAARQLGNAGRRAEDFRKKWEKERVTRNSIDLEGKNLMKELILLRTANRDLDVQNQKLEQEILDMKKNNEDTVNSLCSQLGARVNVEVEVPPAVDLNKLLAEIRDQYEEIMENNKMEVENWFIAKSEVLRCEEQRGSHQPWTGKSNTMELKHSIQTLEIDLQGQLSRKSALENTLIDTKEFYSSQLLALQDRIHKMESKLAKIRHKHEHQIREYKILMDVTMHLEKEITTYRCLLDEQDIRIPRPPLPGLEGCVKGIKFLSVTEEVERRKILAPRGDC